MKSQIAILLLATASLAATASTTAPATSQRSRTRESFSERYGSLSQHNIFLRERSRPTTQRSEPARKTTEELLVLTGIVAEDDGFRAYFENQEGGAGLKVSMGDKLASGVVVSIAFDAVEYETQGGRRWIETGNNLLGKQVTIARSSPTSEPSADAPPATGPSGSGAPGTTAAAPNPNDPNLSVEQRMRLRRQQETRR